MTAWELDGFDSHDLDQHRRIVTTVYHDAGWRVPELLEHVRKAEDI